MPPNNSTGRDWEAAALSRRSGWTGGRCEFQIGSYGSNIMGASGVVQGVPPWASNKINHDFEIKEIHKPCFDGTDNDGTYYHC